MAERVSKAQRQHLIGEIIEATQVHNQRQLVDELAERGVRATQATVSRDLEHLGALKVRVPGGHSAYAIPELPSEQVAPVDLLRRVGSEWVVSSTVSANLIVLRTPPGSAQVVAAAIDRAGVEGIVGTVAGDDTIIAVADEVVGGEVLERRLAALGGW